jgi:pimeloyl-ACP methyl ester carboxylesterase
MGLRASRILGAFVSAAACSCAASETTSSSPVADASPGGSVCTGAEVDVTLATPTGTLAGTMQTPPACDRAPPLVLVYPGSGPTDRDGNDPADGIETDTYRELAAALAAGGVASVRYDKRGVGASAVAAAPDPSTFTIEDDVDDAALWAQEYARDPRFDGLTLAGHSEGSLWAILVAEEVPAASVISLEGPGRPIADIIRAELAANFANDPTTLAAADQIVDSLASGVPVSDVPASLAYVFAPASQAYLISWMKYDPAAEMAKLTVPVLVVQGTTDAQVSVTDADLLAAANPRAILDVVDGVSHELKDATTDAASQDATYTDPTLPLDTTVVSDVLGFGPIAP